jgi:hypothetical protein
MQVAGQVSDDSLLPGIDFLARRLLGMSIGRRRAFAGRERDDQRGHQLARQHGRESTIDKETEHGPGYSHHRQQKLFVVVHARLVAGEILPASFR